MSTKWTWLGIVGVTALGVIGVIFLIQVLYAEWVFHRFPNKMSTRGQFGDIFGAITAFYTGLAFAGVVAAIVLQTRELALQRKALQSQGEHLESSTLELRRAAEAQTEQAELSAVASELSFNLGVMIRLQEVLYEIADHKESFAYVWGAHDSRPGENSREQLSAHAVLDVLSMALGAAGRLPGFSRNAAEDWRDYTRYVLTNSPAIRREVLANPQWWPEVTPYAVEVDGNVRDAIDSDATRSAPRELGFLLEALSWWFVFRAVQRD
jgi:hypothetical protein